jgi:hypothetical protein
MIISQDSRVRMDASMKGVAAQRSWPCLLSILAKQIQGKIR